MERGDLLEANGGIFKPQGQALNAHAASDLKVLVVGNPANTNASSPRRTRPTSPRSGSPRWCAWTTTARSRSSSAKAGVAVSDITNMTIWGNHSATQYPDVFHAKVKGQSAAETVNDQQWIENDFLPTVQKRGAAIIEARGASSAASAANAAIDHVHDWVLGTPDGDWVSMAIPADGSYGISEGVITGYPVHVQRRRVHDRRGPGDRRVLARRRSTRPSRSSARSATRSSSSA